MGRRDFSSEVVQQLDERGPEAVSAIADYRRVKGVLVPHKRTVTIFQHVTEYRGRHAANNVLLA